MLYVYKTSCVIIFVTKSYCAMPLSSRCLGHGLFSPANFLLGPHRLVVRTARFFTPPLFTPLSSRGLGHGLFKPGTRVRIPVGAKIKKWRGKLRKPGFDSRWGQIKDGRASARYPGSNPAGSIAQKYIFQNRQKFPARIFNSRGIAFFCQAARPANFVKRVGLRALTEPCKRQCRVF